MTLHNNCWIGNDDVIAPVVNDGHSQIQMNKNSVQRQTTDLPPTGCEFASHGRLEKDTFNHTEKHACRKSDSAVCTAFAFSKIRNSQPCIDNLQVIHDAEKDLETDDSTRTYRICPDTEFNMLTKGTGNQSPPIVIGRSNIHIICGADGKSSNQCILKGGYIQMSIHNEFMITKFPAKNVVVSVRGGKVTSISLSRRMIY